MAYLAPARVRNRNIERNRNPPYRPRLDCRFGITAGRLLARNRTHHEGRLKPFTNFKRTHYIMNAAQLDHTAKVLAEMLTFKQPSDAVLSAYFREHKKLGRQDRHEIAEQPLPHCATIKNQYRPAPSARAAAQQHSPHWFSAEAPTSAKSKTCLMKKKQSSSAI